MIVVRRVCETCRWWQRLRVETEPCCYNVDSDMRFDRTDANYSCNHWGQKLEQDGNATWYFNGK